MGIPVRRSLDYCFRPWPSIWISSTDKSDVISQVQTVCTTAYHPQSNRMVDYFIDSWSVLWSTKQHSLVDGGPANCFAQNLNCPRKGHFLYSSWNCVWHNSLLTWRILHSHNYQITSRSIQLYHTIKRPYATYALVTTTNNDGNIPKGLATATHVFIRQDTVRKPLQPPYGGLFLTVKRTDKHYVVDINGQKDSFHRPAQASTPWWQPSTHHPRVNHATSHTYHSLWTTRSFSKPFHVIRVIDTGGGVV